MPDDGTVGVYVHVPFCERVCPYCDFAVVAARDLPVAQEDRFVEGLLRELELRHPRFAGRALETVYFGGGTPSLLRPESIARLLEAICDAFPGAASARARPREVTLEVNPSTVERERLPEFRDVGVDRVSVGVQSFDDGVLKRLGRAHRADAAHRTLEAVAGAGFASHSVDLIVAAPGQTRAGLEADLEQLADYAPQHVSCYELTIEEGTPFALADARGQLERIDEDAAASWLTRVEARLAEAGLPRYEISSYARPGFEAQHNRRYWRRRPVLGIGVGAVSTEPPSREAPHGSRAANPRTLELWRRRVEAGDEPQDEREILAEATARGEAVFLALREVRGLAGPGFAAEFGAPPRRYFAPAIDRGLAQGLLEEDPDGSLRLSARGRLLSDSVVADFV